MGIFLSSCISKCCQYVLNFESCHWFCLEPTALFVVCKLRVSFISKTFFRDVFDYCSVPVLWYLFPKHLQFLAWMSINNSLYHSPSCFCSFLYCHPNLLFWEYLNIFFTRLNKTSNVYWTLTICQTRSQRLIPVSTYWWIGYCPVSSLYLWVPYPQTQPTVEEKYVFKMFCCCWRVPCSWA